MKKYLLILFTAFCCFLFISKVNALQYYVNGTQLGTGIKYYTAGNSNIATDIRDNNSDFPLFIDLSVVPQYGYIAICSALGSNETRSINSVYGSNISDINIVNSTTGCTIPGGSYSSTARVVYFTFSINLTFWDCSAQGTSCIWPNNGRLGLTFYQPNSNEYSLVSYGFSSSEPYNFNDQVDPKVKLQEQQNNLINQQNTILEDNLTTCVDSKNLISSIDYIGSYYAYFNGVSSSGSTILSPGTYTLNFSTSSNVSVYYYTASTGQVRVGSASSLPYTFNFTENANIYVYSGSSFTLNDVMLNKGSSSLPYQQPGQVCGVSTLEEQNRLQQEQNDLLNDDNVSESSSTGSDFFNNFNTSDHGLTGIITAPLNLITSITSKTCSPLVLPLPFVNQSLSLPCMSSIYSQYFGSFYDIYKIITFGIVAYWVCVRIFALVKDFKNPEHDEIEVVDL